MRAPPKVILFDIETAPNVSYTWGRWEQNVIDVREDWYMLTFAYKRLGAKRTTVKSLLDFPKVKTHNQRDKHLVKALWDVFDDADVLIAHNGDRFDIRKAKARFAALGMKPPSPYKSVDTLKIARKFDFGSNKLDDLGRTFGVGRKMPNTGKHLWFSCMAGDPKAFEIMCAYNVADVELLERVYNKLLPWADNHVALNYFTGRAGCPKCQSQNVKRSGWLFIKSGARQRYQCLNCSGWYTDGPIVKRRV